MLDAVLEPHSMNDLGSMIWTIEPTFPRQPPNSGKSYHLFTAKRIASLPQPSDGLFLGLQGADE
jgi:hypothetical protein